jgi:type VI secretion system protein ImpM
VSGSVAASPLQAPAALRGAALGCFGKIPAHGDFIRLGLPRDFIDCWDAWISLMLTTSRDTLGQNWLATWLEAPIWRFALAPGVCGAGAAIGAWMPSVDRVGRYFPLTIAAVSVNEDAAALIGQAGAFLDAAECAGLAVIAEDNEPAMLLAAIAAGAAEPARDSGVEPARFPSAGSLWWRADAPHLPPGVIATSGLPDATQFAAMIVTRAGVGTGVSVGA